MKDSRTKPFLLSIFAYFTVGCTVLTANTVLDSIIHEFSWSDSQGGLLITCMSMGNLVMSIVGNLLMEKTGRRGAQTAREGLRRQVQADPDQQAGRLSRCQRADRLGCIRTGGLCHGIRPDSEGTKYQGCAQRYTNQ